MPGEESYIQAILGEATMAFLQRLFHISLVFFIVGNLLEMGLLTRFKEIGPIFRNPRFVFISFLVCLFIGPAMAFITAKIFPLAAPYALGLLFLGLAPCTPTLPTMVQKIQGDLHYVVVFMLIAGISTMAIMPFTVPLLAMGYDVDLWRVAKSALLLITLPLIIGWTSRLLSEAFADRFTSYIRPLVFLSTFPMVILSTIFLGRDFFSAIGTFAIAAQALFIVLVTAITYVMTIHMKPSERRVLLFGTCTRNIGAAMAPLYSIADGNFDPRIATMCLLNIPLSTACSAIINKFLLNDDGFTHPAGQLTMKR